jgi:hypothetical protein
MAVEHKLSLPANPSPADILSTLSRVYLNPGVQRVVVEGQMVTVRTLGEDEELLTPELLTPDDILSRVEMEEVEDYDVSSFEILFRAFFMVSTQGLEVSHILTGDFKTLRRWLGLPEMVSLGGKLLGVRAQRVESVPDDVLLVVGSPQRGVELGYAQFAVKVSMKTEVFDA